MRILYLITGLRLGGAEKQLLLLAEQMQNLGNEVQVAVMESGGVMVKEFESKGIHVIGLNVKGWNTLPAAYKRFKNLVQKFSPHVVHSHMIHANAFAAFLRLFNSKIKLVCTAHNIKEGNKIAMASYYFTKQVANRATNVSKEAFDYYIKKKYFYPERSNFVPNAIDTQLFDPEKFNRQTIRKELNVAEETFVFFSAGRLHHQKNYPMLLKAFVSVQSKVTSTALYIAGEGSELEPLRALSRELGIADNVVFMGSRDDIPALMKASDCFVLSSNFEGFGLVIAEAMAMQLPVISTNCGGVKEVMGGFGHLVATDDVEGLSNAMIAETQNVSKQCYNASRQYIEENFGVKKVIEQWTKIYKSL